MRTHTHTAYAVAVAAVLSAATPAADAQMYRWIDEHGSVTYSNQPPGETAGIRELTLVDDGSSRMTPQEVRTREILEAERSGGARALREVIRSPGAATVSVPEAGTRAPNPESPAPPRAAIARPRPEAVRDPCLRSSDPKCYERNREAYVPYLGYSPSTLKAAREAEAPGVGGTSSAAGGTLAGGAAPASSRIVPPKSSTYALPPGSAAPVTPRKP